MNIKPTVLCCLATLFLSLFYLQVNATVIIEMDDGNVYVRTDQKGVEGYKGCDVEKAKLVNAYVYTLYQKKYFGNHDRGGGGTCGKPTSKWVKVAKRNSNLSEEVFLNMPEGEYKATVYAAQAIGCTIEGDTKNYPSKSVVYQQEKSLVINLNGEDINPAIGLTTTGASNNDELKIFPNPTSGKLHIQLQNHILKSNANIVFYDLLGREVMNIAKSVDDEKHLEWEVDVSEFAEGAYVLRVFDREGGSYERRVIVQNN